MKEKIIKGWAILDIDKRHIVSVTLGVGRPTQFSIGTWGFAIGKNDSRVVPCEIHLPPKRGN